ncbi:ATP synthase alpha/beta family, nucleotide-binding domain protein, partial [Vibrio parahaemolyticus V-223/04]
MCCC